MADGISRSDVQSQIQAKAAKDPAFRAQLQSSPRETLESELSKLMGRDFKLPADVEINVLEDSARKINVVLPPVEQPAGDRELTDAELETVSGGTCTLSGWSGGSYCCGVYTNTDGLGSTEN